MKRFTITTLALLALTTPAVAKTIAVTDEPVPCAVLGGCDVVAVTPDPQPVAPAGPKIGEYVPPSDDADADDTADAPAPEAPAQTAIGG